MRTLKTTLDECQLFRKVECDKLNTLYFIDQATFDFETEFTTIDLEVFQLLLKKRKYGLIKYYLLIKNSLNWNVEVCGQRGIIGFMPISHFAKLMNCSERTIMRYNEQLEELKLLYISRSKYSTELNQRKTNIYGLYEHKTMIESYHPNEVAKCSTRSISAKYNAYVKKGGKGYSPDQVVELYEQVVQYNRTMDELQLGKDGDEYIRRKKDVSVFNLT